MNRYTLALSLLLFYSTFLRAQTPITSAVFTEDNTGLTLSNYTATSPSDASGSITPNKSYVVSYGEDFNLLIDSYNLGATVYDNFVLPDTLLIQRVDTDRQLIIFYETDTYDNGPTPGLLGLKAEQVENEEALYETGFANAGYDNILVNDATNFANVERVDVIYYQGVVTSSPSTAVFPIVERGGNDDIRVAAIRGLDSNGEPNDYYPTVVRVSDDGTSDWGGLGRSISTTVLRRQSLLSNPLPVQNLGGQPLSGSAISFDEFGVAANEIVYGYSIFADDVTVTGSDLIDFTNATNFPRSTGSASGLDLIAGISTAVASDDNLIKVSGPGGYKPALNTWLKANVGVTTDTDNNPVTDWQDQFLGNHDATNLGTAPTYRDGSASALEDINFNPTIDYISATDRGMTIANNTTFNDGTYEKKSINIAIRTGDDVTTKQQIYEQGGTTRGLNVYLRAGSIYVGAWNEANDGAGAPWNFTSVSASVSTDTEYIITIELDGNNTTTGQLRAFLNGQSIGTMSNVGLLYPHLDDIGIGNIAGTSLYDDGSGAASSFYGSIPEIIYCNEPAGFPSLARNQIESYLAVKYGITLDQSTPVSYYNSDGVIVMNTSLNASIGGYLEYNNDIAGLARDDESEFLQLRSQSENPNSIVEMNRLTSIGTDDTWLLWGNDGGATTTSQVLTSPDNIEERLERVWRVAERNEVGVTDVSFDLSGLGLGSNPDNFSLLVANPSSNANFSSADVITGGTFNGDVLTFSGVNFTNGQYFTLGTQFFICTPGDFGDGLAFWLKANEGVTTATEGANVTQWDDQSRNSNNATDVTTAPIYRATTSLANFNSTIDFSTNTAQMTIADASGINLGTSASKKISLAFTTGTDITATQVIYEQGGATRGLNIYINGGNVYALAWNDNNDGDDSPWNGTLQAVSGTVLANTSYVLTFDLSGSTDNTTSGTFTAYLNGQTLGSISNVGTLYQDTNDVGIGFENGATQFTSTHGTGGSEHFDGLIMEIALYDQPSTFGDIERKRVESYLGLKYGITLSNDENDNASAGETLSGAVTEGDYVASNGSTIVWDYSEDTGFISNVGGIGRDDNSCLDQKQSRSDEAGSILTVGLGEIAATNAANANTFDDDLDFFTWGTDGASTAFANRTTDGTPGTVTERMLRIWRAQDTGNVGATDVSFDLTGLVGYSTDAAEYQLIIANGGDNASLDAGSTVIGGAFSGSVITFSNVDIADGQYFTLGVASDPCGPGGVTGNLQIWLRADIGTNTTTNGSDVTSWSDQSGNSNNATATDAPIYNSNNNNFNPSIDFTAANGDNMQIADGANLNPNQQSLFLVGAISAASQNDAPFVLKSNNGRKRNGWGLNRDGNTTTIQYHKDNFSDNSNGADLASRTIVYDETNIHVAFKDANYNYNLNLGTTDVNVPGSTFQTTSNIIFLGASASGNANNNNNVTTPADFLDGSISEMVMFDATITATQRQQVATYMAVKYGITLDQTSPTNYIWSDGTTVLWDATTNASYNNDIAGIGRDDLSCFSQKQATSSNSDDILTIGLGSVAATNADNLNFFADNGDYLIWGNDNGATAQASVNTVDIPTGLAERMERIWRVEDTGNVGETEIQFDLSGLGYSTDASDFRLIIAGSGSGGDMSTGSLTAGGTFDGNVLSFSGIDLADGEYFTLGLIEQCGPGGVNTNVALWLRADEEAFSDAGTTLATNNEDVLQWNDQTLLNRNASELNAGGGTPVEPVFVANDINFNPTIFISDQNTTNNSYLETGGGTNNVADDMTLISVFRSGQSQGTNNQIDNTPALIGAEANANNNDYGLGFYQGEVVFNATNNNSFTVRSTTTYNDNEPLIATGRRIRNGAVNLFVNSENLASSTSADVALSTPGTWAIGNQSDYDNEAQLQANVGEAIVFSNDLTDEELARVDTYLAIKYGITRTDDNNGNTTTNEVVSGVIREGDYVAADGGVIWDYAARGATFYNDIAGIGRDDLSCLNQLRSKSENNDAIVDIGIDDFLNDDSWLVWGNDDAAIEATRNPERPPGINSRLNREWQAQETGTVGTVSVTFDLADVTGTPTGDNNLSLTRMMVSQDDDFRSGVTLVSPSSIDAVNRTVTFTYDFTPGEGFYYTLGSEEISALPIELVSFNGKSVKEGVQLNWVTASEENNAFFTVERSQDGLTYTSIAFVEGSGNSDEVNRYEYIDSQPKAGNNFYRIRQTDTDGTSTFTSVINIWVDALSRMELTLYPNPATASEVYLRQSMPEQEGEIVLFNPQSREVARLKTDTSGTTAIDISGLPAGIYFIRIQFKERSFTQRLLIR